jgi:hypothetical protein
MSLQKKVKLETKETSSNIEEEKGPSIESVVLETRKVKALEKIANSLDALTVWFEEINKKEWSERIAFYLYEFYNIAKDGQVGTQIPTKVNEKLEAPETKEAGAELPPPRKIRPKKDIEKA